MLLKIDIVKRLYVSHESSPILGGPQALHVHVIPNFRQLERLGSGHSDLPGPSEVIERLEVPFLEPIESGLIVEFVNLITGLLGLDQKLQVLPELQVPLEVAG